MNATTLEGMHSTDAARDVLERHASSEAPTATPTPAITVEIRLGDDIVEYSYEDLGRNLVAGTLIRSTPARLVPATIVAAGGDRSGLAWSDLGTIARDDPRLRLLYRPVWHHAVQGLAYGAAAGAALKLLDTTVLMYGADGRLGLLWLITLGSIVASRWLPWLPFLLAFKMAAIGAPNLHIAALSSGAVGALIGAPLGMAVGTAVGYWRRASLQTAADAEPEGMRPAILGFALPFAAGAALLAVYLFVVNPWIADVLSRS